ncbi:MAG: 50S ribosomal protein L35 [Candidatus Omnitrophota bacterium]
MPKLKTKKAMQKRFKITKKGKVKRTRAGRRHILTSKSRKRKRNLRRSGLASKEEARTIKRAMPYA